MKTHSLIDITLDEGMKTRSQIDRYIRWSDEALIDYIDITFRWRDEDSLAHRHNFRWRWWRLHSPIDIKLDEAMKSHWQIGITLEEGMKTHWTHRHNFWWRDENSITHRQYFRWRDEDINHYIDITFRWRDED